MFSADDLKHRLSALQPANASGYVVGLSGGADSTALLAALCALRLEPGFVPVRAVHIDHGLQSAASSFAQLCDRHCRRFGVPLKILRVSIDPETGRSVEELARESRYAALEKEVLPREILLTAHHLKDQAETFLLQALRGAGPSGLAAMPAANIFGRGWHLRPLLDVEVSDLRGFTDANGIEHAQDAMNADERFDRAYLRHAVWPVLERRWPAAAAVLSRSASHVAQSQRWCDDITQMDLDACRDGDAISATRLRHLSRSRQLAVLRAFLAAANCRAPSQRRLEEGLRQMLDARSDRMPSVHWAEHALRRFRNRIHLTSDKIQAPDPIRWQWQTEPVLAWGTTLGTLRLRPCRGGLDPTRLPEILEVRARAGGESLKPAQRAATREVRHLYQARGIVPWMRSVIPYLYAGDSLMAVADLWTDARRRAALGAPGLALAWDDAPPVD